MKKFILSILFLLASISGMALSRSASLPIIDYTDRIHFGHELTLNNRNIDVIIIHSSYYLGEDSFSVSGVLNQYKGYDVAPHYLIDRDGVIFRLVDERNIAFHAGKSVLPADSNRTNLNATSIGIELINTPTTPPTDRQYQSLLLLVQDIKNRHHINYVLGHSDIAAGRKSDPWCFNWPVFNAWVWGDTKDTKKEIKKRSVISDETRMAIHNAKKDANPEPSKKEDSFVASSDNNLTTNNKQ